MTFNTGNNVPSTSPRDLYDNAENLDKLVNGAEPFYADRLGKLRESWAGMENSFTNAQEGRETAFGLSQDDKESRFQAFLVSSGYVDIGPYAAGVEFTARNQYVAVDGQFYRPGAAVVMPYVATGDWLTESERFVLLGDDVLRQDLANGTEFLVDAGVVGLPSGLPVSQAIEDLYLRGSLNYANVKDFGAVGDGVADDTTAVIAARDAALADKKVLYFPTGNFALSSLDIAFAGLKVRCEPTTILTHTGEGRFITADAGVTGDDYIFDIHFTGYPTIQGNAQTTDAFYIRSCHHMIIDIRVRDCDAALRADFTVLSQIRVNHSVNQAPFLIKTPTNTIILDKRTRADDNAIEPSTANTIWIISEGVSGAGLLFNYAQVNHVLGGTSEANGIGVDVKAESSGNRIDSLFMEANSIIDVSDASSYTEYNNCYAGSDQGSVIGTGFKRRITGGFFKNLVVNTPAGFTRLTDVNLAGTFADNSVNTIRQGCHNLGTRISDRPNGAWKANKAGTAQTGIATRVWTKVTFPNEPEDSLNIYNPATSAATPASGYFEFTATVSINAGVIDSGIYGVAIYKNGSRIAEVLQHASGTNQISVSVTTQDRSDGSGTYEVYAYGNGAGDKTIGGAAAESWFSGRYLMD